MAASTILTIWLSGIVMPPLPNYSAEVGLLPVNAL
nr:MAG TPA: hypothetical protein [Caudoviricetes sp.]